MTAHSIIPPSSLARIVQCPASVVMEAAYPETGERDQQALDGEASHWAASEMLQGRLTSVGDRAPNGVVLDVEMVQGADLMYDDVVQTMAPFGMRPEDGASEVTLDIRKIHPACFGTPDYRAWVPRAVGGNLRLIVWDYKFGHRVVEAFENWQGVAYVCGALEQATAHDRYVDVEFRVVQPRAPHPKGPVRSWSFTGSDLRPYVERASAAAAEALGPAPAARVGPECRDCRARHACPTLQAAALSACDVAGQASPFDMPPVAMGLELRTLRRAAELLAARISGLEEQALAVARRGVPVPGWRVATGRGRTVWTVPDAEVIEMGRLLGVDVAKPPEALTPLQSRDAGLPSALVDGISTTRSGAAVLVPDDGSLARQVFR